MKTIKLSQKMQWDLVNKFITVRRKIKPEASIIKQSLPEIGVYVDDDFFPVSYLVEVTNKRSQELSLNIKLEL